MEAQNDPTFWNLNEIYGMDKRSLGLTDPNRKVFDHFIEPDEAEIYKLNPGKDGDDRMLASFKFFSQNVNGKTNYLGITFCLNPLNIRYSGYKISKTAPGANHIIEASFESNNRLL